MSQTCRRAKYELRNKAQPSVRINNLAMGLSLMGLFLKVKLILRDARLGILTISNEDLSKLTRLTELSFPCFGQGNGQDKPCSIKRLINLEWLQINQYPFDCDDLKFLTKLTHLSVFSNPIRGSSFTLMTNLTSLNISNCCFVTDDSLRNFPNLIHLKIGWDTSIISDRGLLHVPKLQSLDVNGNKHVTAAGILTLTCLQFLQVGNSPQIDGSFSKLTSLKKLELLNSENHVTDSAIENMLGLESLLLYNNEIITSKAVAKLTSLRELILDNIKGDIFDMTILSSVSKLQILKLRSTGMTFENVRCLQNLTSLDVVGEMGGFDTVNLFELFPKLRSAKLLKLK